MSEPGSTHGSTMFQRAIEGIDRENLGDPTLEWDPDSKTERPKEWLYGRRMSARLAQFAPDSSEVVRLAARAQHIRRWDIPRSQFPAGRTGYLQWRIELYAHHAEQARRILGAVGYDEKTIERVSSLLRKRKLKTDPEAQLIEDTACLVFLEFYFHDFATKHEPDKLDDILRKTWQKMSPRAHEAALELPLAPADRARILAALA